MFKTKNKNKCRYKKNIIIKFKKFHLHQIIEFTIPRKICKQDIVNEMVFSPTLTELLQKCIIPKYKCTGQSLNFLNRGGGGGAEKLLLL